MQEWNWTPQQQAIIDRINSGVTNYTFGPGSPDPTPEDLETYPGGRRAPAGGFAVPGGVALAPSEYYLFTPAQRRYLGIMDIAPENQAGLIERYFRSARDWTRRGGLVGMGIREIKSLIGHGRIHQGMPDQPYAFGPVENSNLPAGETNFIPGAGFSPNLSEPPMSVPEGNVIIDPQAQGYYPGFDPSMIPTNLTPSGYAPGVYTGPDQNYNPYGGSNLPTPEGGTPAGPPNPYALSTGENLPTNEGATPYGPATYYNPDSYTPLDYSGTNPGNTISGPTENPTNWVSTPWGNVPQPNFADTTTAGLFGGPHVNQWQAGSGRPTQNVIALLGGAASNLLIPGLGLIVGPALKMLVKSLQSQGASPQQIQAAISKVNANGSGDSGPGNPVQDWWKNAFSGLPKGFSEVNPSGIGSPEFTNPHSVGLNYPGEGSNDITQTGGAPFFPSEGMKGPDWGPGGSIFGGPTNLSMALPGSFTNLGQGSAGDLGPFAADMLRNYPGQNSPMTWDQWGAQNAWMEPYGGWGVRSYGGRPIEAPNYQQYLANWAPALPFNQWGGVHGASISDLNANAALMHPPDLPGTKTR